MLVFAKHNLLLDPPFTKINILSCRNLLIYMDLDSQRRLLGMFHYSIVPNGFLVLGSSESLGTQSHLFTPREARLKIFKRSGIGLTTGLSDLTSSFTYSPPNEMEKQTPKGTPQNIQTLADQLILQQFSPAGVLVNDKGDIIYTSKRTGRYLEPAVGKANMNILAMLREGLRNEFPVAFRKAINSKQTVHLHNIKVDNNGVAQLINVSIHWIDKPELLTGTLMVIFSDMPPSTAVGQLHKRTKKSLENGRILELETELLRLREEMQNALEEMQTAQEELKSSNEELQSTNEELQSANEELTTSKEEMQSLNEELQTVNAELQSKVDDYSRVDNDMKNLLNSIDIATLFLDKELNIRRYTNQAIQIFKLIKSDIGRPITDLVSDLIYPELATDALDVLESLVPIQKQIPAKDGRSFSIKLMPYRTFDDRIDGLVITFINISEIRQLELALHERAQTHRLLLNASTDVIIQLSSNLTILEFNPQAEVFFGKKKTEVVNQDFVGALIAPLEKKKTESLLAKALNEALNGNYKIKVLALGGKMYDIDVTINVLLNSVKKPVGLLLITNRQ
jgi:two-component system, chemotaxis family, CheB/CheR fusion protein